MRIILLLVLIIVTVADFTGQTREVGQLNFRHFNVENGLSQGSVNAILQDHKGFIWIGTHDGLNRFDGVEFSVFRSEPGNPHSLSSSWISGIVEDDSGTLWVKTEKGIDRFNRATGSFLQVDKENDAVAESLFEGNKRHALSVSEKYKIDMSGITTILPSRHVPGDMWLGRTSGLLRLRNGKSEHVGKFPNVTSLTEDSQGFLWIGTHDGLARLDTRDSIGGRIARFHHDPLVPTSLSHDIVTHLYEDASGGVWVGTYNGLNLFDRFSPAFSVYRSSPENPKSIGSNFVLPIVEDLEGNIWFGTFGGGVSLLHTQGAQAGTFSHFRHDPSDPNSLRSDNIRSIICTRKGQIWIGSLAGLNIYDPSTRRMTALASASSQTQYTVETMHESDDGSIWIPEGSHLWRVNNVQPSLQYSERFPLPHQTSVNFILGDSKAILWLATTQEGLIRFDPGTKEMKQYAHDPGNPKSLSNNNVWCIYQGTGDTSGTLWIGTSLGLNKFDSRTGTCERYLAQEGFPNSWVYGILQDDQQRLWLSTNQGLVVFDDRQPEGRKFRNFTHADGLAGDEFNRRSFCRLRNGEFLFGGPNGVTRFHPANVVDNPTVPPLVLTGFYKLGTRIDFDRDIADVSTIELNQGENVFSFEYAALNFSTPSRHRYAYMMEGIDNDWIYAGARRSVNYAYVPSGTYVFRVKTSHLSGLWNDNQIVVQVRIHPPFWATWWFIAACILTGGAVVAMIIRARVRRLLEMERLRSRIARDLHDEIGSNLSSIAMASDLLGRQTGLGERERGKLSEISSVALSTVKDMKDIVWLLNPGNDALDDLFLRMKDTAGALLNGCTYTMNFPDQSPDRKVNLEWKQNLYLIYKETLTNIMRHSQATEVVIDVQLQGDRLCLRIKDNGVGFDRDAVRSGSGLRNIRERAKLLKAELGIEASHGRGTTVTLATRIT